MKHETVYICYKCKFQGSYAESKYCPMCGKNLHLRKERMYERELRSEVMQSALSEGLQKEQEDI